MITITAGDDHDADLLWRRIIEIRRILAPDAEVRFLRADGSEIEGDPITAWARAAA